MRLYAYIPGLFRILHSEQSKKAGPLFYYVGLQKIPGVFPVEFPNQMK
jgi:hypothetical protein